MRIGRWRPSAGKDPDSTRFAMRQGRLIAFARNRLVIALWIVEMVFHGVTPDANYAIPKPGNSFELP